MTMLFSLLVAQAQPAPEIQAHLMAIRTANQDIRELSLAPRSSAVVKQIQRKSHDIDRRLDAIAALVQMVPPPVVVIEPPPGPVVTTDAEVAGLVAALDDESFPKQRLARLQDIARDRWFTAAQVVRMLNTFDFPDNQVEAAVFLHPHVVDPEQWHLVYDTFDFPSHRDEVRRRTAR